MDAEVRNRLELVWKRLDAGLSSSGRSNPPGRIRDRRVAGILNKWKYRSRKGADGSFRGLNRFLPEKLQRLTPLYVNMVDVAARELGSARWHDLKGVLERCQVIQEACAGTLLDWDECWNNPLTWASKGWVFSSIDPAGDIVCKCGSCLRTTVMDLKLGDGATDSWRESYWLNGAVKTHDLQCPWRENRFDLDKDYYLQWSNLIRDINRVQKALAQLGEVQEEDTSGTYLTKPQLTTLERFFDANGRGAALIVLLRGYEFIQKESEVVQCTACFIKTFTKNVLNSSKLNYHTTWCRYRQEALLPTMILDSLGRGIRSEESQDVAKRLHNLETYLEGI